MPVQSIEKQLQERGIVGNFPRVGKYRKGAEKPERGSGKDLDFFRLTLEPQYEFLREYLDRIYGEQPREFNPVYLAADSANSAFQYWREDWVHAKLLKRCDEKTIVSHFDEGEFRQSSEPFNCTCDPFNRTCGLVGRLDIVPVQACEESGFWFKITVETGSFYDCLALRGYMIPVSAFMDKIPNIAFWSVPFVVGRAPRKVPVTMADKQGKKTRSIKEMSLLYLYVLPEYNHTVLAPMLSAPAQALLEAGANPETGELPEIEITQAASWDRDYINAQTLHLFDNENHQANAIDKLIAEGVLTDEMTDTEAITALLIERNKRDAEKAAGNVSKTSKKGANSSAVTEPVQTPLNAQFAALIVQRLKISVEDVLNALKWCSVAPINTIEEFEGTKEDAWAACVAFKVGYDLEALAQEIPEENNAVRKLAERMIDKFSMPF